MDARKFKKLFSLLRDNESPVYFANLPPAALLLRWMNFHLKEHGREITNFTDDLEVGGYVHWCPFIHRIRIAKTTSTCCRRLMHLASRYSLIWKLTIGNSVPKLLSVLPPNWAVPK